MRRILRAIWRYFFGPSCVVYAACKMSGRDKLEMIKRARFLVEVGALFGVHVISPVLEENVKEEEGKLVNHDLEKLRNNWRRDKEIIRRLARVTLIDHGEMKSMGFEREYCLNRGVLWKPTVMFVPKGTILSVAQFEDDLISYSVHDLFFQINKKWGSRAKYWIWRCKMINRSLPGWLLDQCYAWK